MAKGIVVRDAAEPGLEKTVEKEPLLNGRVISNLISAVIFVVGILFRFSDQVEMLIFLASYLLSGGEVVHSAVRSLFRGDVFNENFLMSVATIGAFATGNYPESVAVMLFYQVGMFLEDAAVSRSRRAIAGLMDLRPDYANLKVGAATRKVSAYEVKAGDIVIVKPGERIPLDGKVIEGASTVNTVALTGESVPRAVRAGDEVLGGFMNINGLLTVEVSREFGQSAVAKILELVEEASDRKAPTESFITRFARGYTPVVTAMALLIAVIPPLTLPGASFSSWLYRALVFLAISCPCALVVSIPLGFFGGIGGASRNGILVKGSNFLEALNRVGVVVFDKTGTLTRGVFKVTDIRPREGMTKEQLLEYAALVESYSNHPIAASVLGAYGKEVDRSVIEDYEEIPGHGVKARVRGREVLAGNEKLMEREGLSYDLADTAGTIVHLAVDRKYAGFIVISDEIKEDSAKAIKALRSLGVKKIAMLTGDSKATGEKVGRELGLDEVYAGLLPHQKVEMLKKLDSEKPPKSKILFVGDGINDAPVLAMADIGAAMGGLGADAAIEAADVVLMTDEPSRLAGAIKIARRTRLIVWQNIVFTLFTKVFFMALGAAGLAGMWEAVFADVGVTLIAVLNSLRAIRVERV